MIGKNEIIQYVRENWKNKAMLTKLVGQQSDCESSFQDNWGTCPTEKMYVTVEHGCIAKIETWSGLRWSARNGYGAPYLSVSIEEEEEEF